MPLAVPTKKKGVVRHRYRYIDTDNKVILIKIPFFPVEAERNPTKISPQG